MLDDGKSQRADFSAVGKQSAQGRLGTFHYRPTKVDSSGGMGTGIALEEPAATVLRSNGHVAPSVPPPLGGVQSLDTSTTSQASPAGHAREVGRSMQNRLSRKLPATSLFVLLMVLLSAALSPAQDPGWPRQITKPGGKLVLYQPQVDDWKDYKQVDARMAFTLTPTAGKSHVGVVTVQLQSAVNVEDHTVFLSDPQITSVSFPSLDPATTAQMDQLMKTFLNPAATMTISLDRLAASVKKTKTPPVADVQNNPPAIFISMRPAILLLVNGSPVTAPIANSNLQFIVNANWPLFAEQGSSAYYLFDGKGWMTCASLQGSWTPTNQLPPQMPKVLQNPNFTSLKGFIP